MTYGLECALSCGNCSDGKRVTTSTAPVGATVIQGYTVTDVNMVSIYIVKLLLLDKNIHGKQHLLLSGNIQ